MMVNKDMPPPQQNPNEVEGGHTLFTPIPDGISFFISPTSGIVHIFILVFL